MQGGNHEGDLRQSSGDFTEFGKPKFLTPSKTFTDVFLRKNGYTTIYKNGSSAKYFQIAKGVEV